MTIYLPKVLITGGRGQLASALTKHPLAEKFSITSCTHSELDISQPASIEFAIGKHLPDLIINTAAYTAVDSAEENASAADKANHIGAGQLALLCNKNQIKLLHISTDYIFDGSKQVAYDEDDPAAPINFYGKSKWEGEEAIRNSCPNHLILRVSGVFSEYGNNFLKTIHKLARERSTLRVVADQVTCPTYAGDIAGAIWKMCLAPSHKGTYHYCSAEAVSWFDFAKEIVNESRLHEKLVADEVLAIISSEFPTAAKRPQHSVLNCDKIKTTFDIDQPSWRDAIKLIIPKLIQEKA
jgi:dTDP-4-dehydrorhamnose reductase